MADQKPKNNLAAQKPPVNALRGDREDIKAYLGLMGFDDSVMTERHLSPKALAEFRETVRKTLATKDRDSYSILNNYPHDEGSTRMHHVVGKVAPSNMRQVNIAGVPYYQVLDRYDFDLGKEGGGSWMDGLVGGVGQLVTDPGAALDMAGGNSPWGPEKFAGKLGLQRNLNYLIPVDPSRVAPEEALEAYRRGTNLPYPSKTLGKAAVNALLTPRTPYEKVQP